MELMPVKIINGITKHGMTLSYMMSSFDKNICLIGTCIVFDNVDCIYLLYIYLFALYSTLITVASEP